MATSMWDVQEGSEAPRVPRDLARVLSLYAGAHRYFHSLPEDRRRSFLDALEAATEDVRRHRIAETVAAIRAEALLTYRY